MTDMTCDEEKTVPHSSCHFKNFWLFKTVFASAVDPKCNSDGRLSFCCLSAL